MQIARTGFYKLLKGIFLEFEDRDSDVAETWRGCLLCVFNRDLEDLEKPLNSQKKAVVVGAKRGACNGFGHDLPPRLDPSPQCASLCP